jgi:hypothetical protein
MDSDLKSLKDFVDKIGNLQSIDSKIVEKSNFTDSSIMTRESPNIKDTPEEARHEYRYLATRKKEKINEKGIGLEELDKASDEIAKNYVIDFLDSIFK